MSNILVIHPESGCIVEFMQGNALQLAYVLDNKNGKLRVLLPNRRETDVPESRLLPWSGPQGAALASREAAIEFLNTHLARRSELESSLNPVEWWDMAHGEVEHASALWFAELVLESPDIDSVAACGHVLLACKTHYKFQPPLFDVLSEEVVSKRIEEQEREASRERFVKQGTAFMRALWDVFQKKAPPPSESALRALDSDVVETMRKLLLRMIAEPDEPSDPMWKSISKGLPDDPNLALHLAQAWGIVGPHHNIWMERAGYESGDEWSEAFLDECARLAESVRQVKLPEISETFISIDNASTKDIDDAFNIAPRNGGGWNLTLALAAPALCWRFDEPLDKAVRLRSTSIYLPEGTSHMLPEKLGTGILSLFAGEYRPAFIVRCEIDSDGAILACEPLLAQVKLADNLSYADAEGALNGENTPATPYKTMLETALELARARQTLRVKNGAVIIYRPDLIITLNGDISEKHIGIELALDDDFQNAHLLVAEQMIIANIGLAMWAKEHGIPLIFRSQDSKTAENISGVWKDPVQVATVVRQLAPAVMDTTPRPHIGIGANAYAPITSPLRRYPDFVNESQILSFIMDGKARLNSEALDHLLTYLNTRLDAANTIQRLRVRYWKLLYLLIHNDRLWEGIVTDINDMFAVVNLVNEQVIVRGRRDMFPENTRTGQNLLVRLGKINPIMGDILLLEVQETNAE